MGGHGTTLFLAKSCSARNESTGEILSSAGLPFRALSPAFDSARAPKNRNRDICQRTNRDGRNVYFVLPNASFPAKPAALSVRISSEMTEASTPTCSEMREGGTRREKNGIYAFCLLRCKSTSNLRIRDFELGALGSRQGGLLLLSSLPPTEPNRKSNIAAVLQKCR